MDLSGGGVFGGIGRGFYCCYAAARRGGLARYSGGTPKSSHTSGPQIFVFQIQSLEIRVFLGDILGGARGRGGGSEWRESGLVVDITVL
jgi:hypothetical protein